LAATTPACSRRDCRIDLSGRSTQRLVHTPTLPATGPPDNLQHHQILLRRPNARGYSQEAFALAAGLDRSYMGAIERGELNRTLETLLKVTTGRASLHRNGWVRRSPAPAAGES
jgi:hypothetical protein